MWDFSGHKQHLVFCMIYWFDGCAFTPTKLSHSLVLDSAKTLELFGYEFKTFMLLALGSLHVHVVSAYTSASLAIPTQVKLQELYAKLCHSNPKFSENLPQLPELPGNALPYPRVMLPWWHPTCMSPLHPHVSARALIDIVHCFVYMCAHHSTAGHWDS